MVNINTDEYNRRVEYLESVSRNIEELTGKKINFRYAPDEKEYYNASITKNTLKIFGNWGDFTTDPALKKMLLCVIGHELGHMDNQPMHMPSLLEIVLPISFLLTTVTFILKQSTLCKIMAVVSLILLLVYIFCKRNEIYLEYFGSKWNKLCEYRADYCGVIFATEYLKKYEPELYIDRNDLVNAASPVNIVSFDRDHPLYIQRSDYLLYSPVLNEDTLQSMCSLHTLSNLETRMLKSVFYRGKMFDLKNNTLIKS
ncbi:MAG: M48 family metalloprotease [Oscillospiraceae bacterium]|nr:M48 family metalloprotease [Oscillospiraceae bacterium]